MSAPPVGYDFEYFQTPKAFTRWLFKEVPIHSMICEPCAGDGAIIQAVKTMPPAPGISIERGWITNDWDPRWPADYQEDARTLEAWNHFNDTPIDWTVTNPPFAGADEVLSHALHFSRCGVAFHIRVSFNEPLKTADALRTRLLRSRPPNRILFLPRYPYQRNAKGKWGQDSVACCWLVWEHAKAPDAPAILYAPESVVRESQAEHLARGK